MTDDASATYRGFRNQALYALHRLLTDANASERTYRPEGNEDLAIYDSHGQLIEAIQVKDYSTDLPLSALKPKSDVGFFARLQNRKQNHPHCTTKLASFGPLGPELRGAIRNKDLDDAKHRTEVIRKLCESNNNISAASALAMLNDLQGNVVQPVKGNLTLEIIQFLGRTIVAGELKVSLELLMYWVFDASEHRRYLTRQGLILQLERIGRYLTALRDHSAEWGVSLCAIKAAEFNSDEVSRLIADYRQGVQARWEHIVAGADCVRPDRMDEIHRQLQHHPAVIVRGASGQGKSTLGWRYIHNYCAEGVRFHVKLVEGREHAIRIANALGEHVRRLNLKAVAYIDVSPKDIGWSELVRELVAAGLKVLIAVREEDFRRANVAIGDFNYGEVVLDRVTKEEAQLIFSALDSESAVNALDFEEVWSRFASEEGGPLLEFTYLVSEGESLASRISSQVRRVQDEAAAKLNGLSEVHLEMLALAAVANETGACVSMRRLCDHVGINPLIGPFQALESEYLLRLQNDDAESSVGPLHALRSKAIVNALFHGMPELWVEHAIKVLPLVMDEDIESFLLAVFSRRSNFGDKLFNHILMLAPRSWTHAACITNALIWEGMSRYERKNRDVILEAISKYGDGWWLLCDTFVGMVDDHHRELLETMESILKKDIQSVLLTPKAEIFDLFMRWASNVPAPSPPCEPREWASAGDIAYWLGHTNVGGMLRTALESLLPTPLPPELNIEGLSRFVSGRARIGDSLFTSWHNKEKSSILQKFVSETDSAYVADDGHEVKVYYSVPLAESATEEKPVVDNWHEQTMKRVRFLRLLFPNHETFGAQGLGLETMHEWIKHDPTLKRIPAKSLPMERSVRLNSIFAGVVAYRNCRLNTWKEYADAILAYRDTVTACFRKLHRGWAKLLTELSPKKNTLAQLPTAEIDQIRQQLKRPMFPRSAVDEWGFISERQQNTSERIETMQERSLRRFNPWQKVFNDFESNIGMVIGSVVDHTILYVAECKGQNVNEEDDKKSRLFLVNLGSAWESLHTMQREFRVRLGRFYPSGRLDDLEMHERSNFHHLWAIAIAMRYERHRHISGIGQMVENEIARRKSRFLQSLEEEVKAALGDFGTVTVKKTPWVLDELPHLCIVCDYRDLKTIETLGPSVVEAVWRASQAGAWREFEWKPLEVEWPKIALMNLVRGKAILPACATISTIVLFATPDAFEVQPHHYIALPVRTSDFEAGGFQLWESPLLRTALSLQGGVLAFAITNARFYQLVKLIVDYKLEKGETDRVFAKFSRELNTVLTVAQRSYSECVQILDTIAIQQKERWKEDLRRLCQILLYTVDEDSDVSLDLDAFVSWGESYQGVNKEFQNLVIEIIAYALNDVR